MKAVWIIIGPLAILTADCARRTQEVDEVSGQVFVVMKNRITVKLSMVSVALVESNVMARRISMAKEQCSELATNLSGKKAAIQEEIKKLQAQKEAVRAEIDLLNAQSSELAARAYEMPVRTGRGNYSPERWKVEAAKYKALMDESAALSNQAREELAKESNVKAFIERRYKERDEVEAAIAGIYWQDFVFFGPPPAKLDERMTDSDGNFKLKLPHGSNAVVFAISSRETFKDQEDYYWMVPVDPTKPIFLNNANMTPDWIPKKDPR